ncbi:MAG: enoyl-CoA hydratase/isomerase family protein [bacterium]
MEAYHIDKKEDLGILHLHAGGANALNYRVMNAIAEGVKQAQTSGLKGLVLTGYERFFSAGLDLIVMYDYDRRRMSRFLEDFDIALQQLFAVPIPVVAAINGAATAGGCILALACDYRLMTAGSVVIGLNEIRLGLPLPASALEIARYAIPAYHQVLVLYSGKLFDATEAHRLGLVHEVVAPEELLGTAAARLRDFTNHPGKPHATLKTTLRGAALERMIRNAGAMREAFLDAWFNPEARKTIGEVRDKLLAKKVEHKK